MRNADLLEIIREANLAGQERLRAAGKLTAAAAIARRLEDGECDRHAAAVARLLAGADSETLRQYLCGWGWGLDNLLTREVVRGMVERHERLRRHLEAAEKLLAEQQAEEVRLLGPRPAYRHNGSAWGHRWLYSPAEVIGPAVRESLDRLRAWTWPKPSAKSKTFERDAGGHLLAYLRKLGLSPTTEAPRAAAFLLWYSGLLGEPEEAAPGDGDLLGTLTERVRSWEKTRR